MILSVQQRWQQSMQSLTPHRYMRVICILNLRALATVSHSSTRVMVIDERYTWTIAYTVLLVVAMSVNCVTAFIAICAATLLRFVLVNLNKKLDRGEAVEGAVVSMGEGIPGEAARKGFRFVL